MMRSILPVCARSIRTAAEALDRYTAQAGAERSVSLNAMLSFCETAHRELRGQGVSRYSVYAACWLNLSLPEREEFILCFPDKCQCLPQEGDTVGAVFTKKIMTAGLCPLVGGVLL